MIVVVVVVSIVIIMPSFLRTLVLGALKNACQEYYQKILKLEDQKYDLEYEVARKDLEASNSIEYYHYYQLPH